MKRAFRLLLTLLVQLERRDTQKTVHRTNIGPEAVMKSENLREGVMVTKRENLVMLVVVQKPRLLLLRKTGTHECARPREPVTQSGIIEEKRKIGHVENRIFYNHIRDIRNHVESQTFLSQLKAIVSHVEQPQTPGTFHGCHTDSFIQ
jgi:hypothetical protein